MDHTLQISQFNMGHVTEILAQILQLYKTAGPQSMETLAQSYLAEAPTAESAADAAEGLMAQAFAQFDHAADAVLRGFAGKQGFDLNDSKNYRRRLEEGYFQVAYPFVVMYMIWLDREGQQRAIEKMDIFFQSVMLGVAGYMILDSNLDELQYNAAEILLSLAFIQEHDRLLLETFDFDAADYALLSRFKQMYLMAEIKEKKCKFAGSPYRMDQPEDCGYKAVHAYLPFALLLQKIGKADQIDEYLQFFYVWGAPLQIMDDIMDLEDDLRNGHYAYPTLGYEVEIHNRPPAEAAAIIRSDKQHMRRLQIICQDLIDRSRTRCEQLDADLLLYFVNILEARLDQFFRIWITGAHVNSPGN